MNEQQTKAIEQAVDQLQETITQLTQERTEIEFRIEELTKVKASLTRLLPTDKRIDKLFN